ncbi:MAG: NUDIX domain-containing protein [Candidatus Brennerbacteria bacterium]
MENNVEKRTPLTLCIVHQPPRILLGMKKRGFGAGRWNGFGGKLLPGETIAQALMREVKEEAGIAPVDPEEMAVIDFRFRHKPDEVLEVHIFRATEFVGTPIESEEMKPHGLKREPFLFDESDVVLEHNLQEL